jgi:hypothetical protein
MKTLGEILADVRAPLGVEEIALRDQSRRRATQAKVSLAG